MFLFLGREKWPRGLIGLRGSGVAASKSTLCGKELYSEVGLLGFITTVIQSCLRLAIGAKIRAKK